MGEAIISRCSGDPETPLPIAPGYHTVGVTLRDRYGKVVPNYPLECTDGISTYNYTTNERGQTVFMVNSGAANIFLNNNALGYQLLDIASSWSNVDAPAGLTTRININMDYPENDVHDFTDNKLFGFVNPTECDINIVGGGGGGLYIYYTMKNYAGGGSGYMNNYPNQIFSGIGVVYNFIKGIGGSGKNPQFRSNRWRKLWRYVLY